MYLYYIKICLALSALLHFQKFALTILTILSNFLKNLH